jgi:hypothetical protein
MAVAVITDCAVAVINDVASFVELALWKGAEAGSTHLPPSGASPAAAAVVVVLLCCCRAGCL